MVLLPQEIRPHSAKDERAIYCSDLGVLGGCVGAISLVGANLTEICIERLRSTG